MHLTANQARLDRMIVLVKQMLAAQKQLAGAQSDKDKDFYTNRCDGLDRQIDALVYDLYQPAPRLRSAGTLTPAEIKIAEGAIYLNPEQIVKTQPECFILTPMPDVASAIAYLAEEEKTYRMREDGKRQKSIEVQLRFNTGAKIDAAFPKRGEAIAFLRSFT